MNLSITLPPGTEKTLQELASRQGKNTSSYVQEILEEKIRQEIDAQKGQRAQTSFDTILAPVREGFRESGLGEQELDDLFAEARQEVWDEKHKKGAP
jgi:hypothetical protein